MQSLATYPLSQPVAVTAPRSGWLAYIRAGTLAFWLFTLLYPFIKIRDWSSYAETAQEGLDFRRYYFVGFAACFLAHLTLGLSAWFGAPFKLTSTWSGRLFTAFCAIAVVVSPLSLVPQQSAVYAVATWGIFVLLYLYWQDNFRVTQRMTVAAGLAVFGWLVFLIFKLGLTYGYAIGGINRNITGTAAVGGMICCLLSPKKSIRWAAIGGAIFMALSVSSRGSLVALAAFLVTYYAVYKGTPRAAAHALIGLSVFVCLALVWPQLVVYPIERVLLLNDKIRGIGGGFTGRMTGWARGFEAFWKKPVFGYGFRAGSLSGGGHGGVHSGYLRIFVETGFVGGILMVGSVVIETVRRFRIVQQFRDLPPSAAPGINIPETTRLNAVVFATLCTTLVLWIYEQLYINLGSVYSLVFWLMFVAPAYITTEGKPIRR